MHFKNLISKINSWKEFKQLLETKTKQEKGAAFEELTKYYLQYNPVYNTKLKTIWLQSEIPSSVIKKLKLPSNDQGIDLIAETFEGTFWAIQCKYLQNEEQRLSHRTISTFVSLSTGIAENISHCLVCTTVDDFAKIYKGKSTIGFVNSDEWRKIDYHFFDWLRIKLSGKEKKIEPHTPKPHQLKAIKEAKHYFVKKQNKRGKLIFPCGAGKSLTGYWITRELKSKSILVAVPSLSLVKQTLEVYLRESVANNDKVAWLCVCSDEGIGSNDDIAVHTNEIGVPCVTDTKYIAQWLKDNTNKKVIIFTTYQSGKTIAEACKMAKHQFELGIMDEAHKTVGNKDKLFSHLLFDENVKIEKRVFMTATERRFAGSSDLVLSMDDVYVYGETFTQMSFKEAIEIGILSDYRIITLFISNKEVKNLIKKNAFVKPIGKEWDKETEARTLASLIALRKAMTDYPIHHAVTFHSSIKKAEAFEKSQQIFSSAYPNFREVKSFHVSGAMPTSARGKIVDEFAETDKAIITNAKCLTEGVDVPNIDCVLFADPRKSTVDIVQAVGRALRKKERKEFGYVILPVFTESNKTEEIINSDEFKEILSTIRALASNDERIIEYFKDISKGAKKNRTDSIIQFNIDVHLSAKINETELIDSIQLKTWDKLAKLSWMPFEEAREFIRTLSLSGQNEYNNYASSGKKPSDIPYHPDRAYKGKGWLNYGDWLGTGNISNKDVEFRDFVSARDFVRTLNLKNQTEWIQYLKSGFKPKDIPYSPERSYKDIGWINLGDWLGTGVIAAKDLEFLPFSKAREFVRQLNFKNQKEWRTYVKSGKKPIEIPSAPERSYKVEGWINWSDWLGTNNASRLIAYDPYEDAKEKVKLFKIKSKEEWFQFCKSGNKPSSIPYDPRRTYLDKGWTSWGDWLGTGEIASQLKIYKSFHDAKKFVRQKKIKTINDYKIFCSSNKKPIDLPNAPEIVYKNKGWKGYPDFLGNGNGKKKFVTYEEAKLFALKLKLNSIVEWHKFYKSNKPSGIPSNPNRVYNGKGWKDWSDFLGTNNISNAKKNFVPYEEAKKHAYELGLNSQKDWVGYCKSGRKPNDIPTDLKKSYKNKGWKNWADFLGKL